MLVTGFGARGIGRPLWRDEVVSALIADRSAFDVWRTITTAEANMAGFYLALRGWVWLLGEGPLAMRAFALLGTAASVALTTILARRHLSVPAALVCGWLVGYVLVVSGMAVEIRSYSWLPALAAALLLVAERLLESPSRRLVVAYAALAAISISFHMVMALVVISQLIGALAHVRTRRSWRRLLAADLIAGLALAPILPVVASRASVQTSWLQRFTLHGLLDPQLGPAPRSFAIVALAVAAAIAFSLGVHRSWKSRQERASTLLLFDAIVPLAVFLLLSFAKPLFSWRYLIAFVPSLGVVAFRALPQTRLLSGALPALFAALTLAMSPVVQPPAYRVENLRAAADVVTRGSRPGDGLIFVPSFAQVGAQYYFLQEGGSQVPETLGPIPEDSHLVFPPPPGTAALAGFASHPRLWVVGYPKDTWQPAGPDATPAVRADLIRTRRLGLSVSFGDVVVERYDR